MNKNRYPRLHPMYYILIICVLIAIILIVLTLYMNNNSVHTLVNSQKISNQSNNMSSVEALASNAISSSTLIVTVIGVFVTAVTIFTAILVFTSSTRLEKVEEKAKELDYMMKDTQQGVNTTNLMWHIEEGKYYQRLGIYDYAKRHYQIVLDQNENNENKECLQHANYQLGSLYIELFLSNNRESTLREASSYYKKALSYGKMNSNSIVWASASAELGYSLGYLYEYFNNKGVLQSSIQYQKNAIQVDEIPIYHKNLAITYALQDRTEDAIKEFECFFDADANSKEIIDEPPRKKNTRILIDNLFSPKEKEVISTKTYNEIMNRLNKLLDNND